MLGSLYTETRKIIPSRQLPICTVLFADAKCKFSHDKASFVAIVKWYNFFFIVSDIVSNNLELSPI